ALILTDYVSDHYFETFSIPMLAGRGFVDTDRANSPQVAVVNEAFAQHYFGGYPVGKRIRIGRNDTWIEIGALTATGKYYSVFSGADDFLYLPYRQHPKTRMSLIAQTEGDPAAIAKPLREMVHAIDPNVPLFAVRTMDDLFDQRSVKVAELLI